MKTPRLVLTACFLAAPSIALAQESDTPTPAPLPPAPVVAAPVAATPVPPPMMVPCMPVAAAPVDTSPEPYLGWGRGKRAPMYVNLMMIGAAFVEDSDNRVTTRDSRTLEGGGGVFRIGAVLNEKHRLGARLQSYIRPTKHLKLTEPAAPGTATEWGGVQFGHAGPEYLFTHETGVYAGGSLGVGMVATHKKLDHHSDDDMDNIDRAAAGASGILSVGYEWRVSKWFAMNAEAFGGYFYGVDDNEKNMSNVHFGVGMGVGF